MKTKVIIFNNGTLRLWDVESGVLRKQIQAHPPQQDYDYYTHSCAAFSPDGQRIVSGGDLAVVVWDAGTGQELQRYEGHTALVMGVTFFPDGKRIASVSFDGTARVWRAPRTQP